MSNTKRIKFGTITNLDLIHIATKLGIQPFQVIMKDQIPEELPNEGNYVVNLQDFGEGGSHWVCFHKKGKNIWFHDSYGMPPVQRLVDILEKTPQHEILKYNEKSYQQLESDHCGFFCLGFFLAIKHFKGSIDQRIKKYTDMFSLDDKWNNDTVIQKFILSFV